MEKIYTIKMEIAGGKAKMTRTNDGFNGLELLGVLEIARKEILLELEGAIIPDEIKRQFVVDNRTLTSVWLASQKIPKGYPNANAATRALRSLMKAVSGVYPYNENDMRTFKYLEDISYLNFCHLRDCGEAAWLEFVKLRGY